jgi:hypothetical protein
MLESGSVPLTEKCSCWQLEHTHTRLRSGRYSLCRAQSEVTKGSRAEAVGGRQLGRGRGKLWVRKGMGFLEYDANHGRALNHLPISALQPTGLCCCTQLGSSESNAPVRL